MGDRKKVKNMKIQLSGCAIINDENELLLLWEIKHQHFEFPGGKVEESETLEQAAKRECYEELNVQVELLKYLGYENFTIEGKNFQSHKFLGKILDEENLKVGESDKFEKYFWLPIEDFEKYFCAPNVKEFCMKVKSNEIKI